MLEKPFDCGVDLTPVEERGKEGGLSRKNVNCRAVLRKFCQGRWGVLKPNACQQLCHAQTLAGSSP